MGEMIPLYGFGGNRGSASSNLTVTAPVGATVTVSKDGKSKPSKVATTGTVVFKGLETGTWTITITDGTDTASKTVEIKADYQAEITFFSATINITYPAGLTCTATDGSTTLTAPDTSGTWACVVPNAGTWTVTLSNGMAESVTIANGDNVIVNKWYLLRSGIANQTYNFGDGQVGPYSVTVTITDGELKAKSGKDSAHGIATNIPLSLAGFNVMSATFRGNRKIYLGGYTKLKNSLSDVTKPVVGAQAGDVSGTVNVDIAQTSDELYVGVAWAKGSSLGEIYISNLWLEV